MKNFLIAVFITFVIFFASYAGAGNLSDEGILYVRILDQTDNSPVPGATVRCWGVNHDEGTTDGEGKITLKFKPHLGNDAECRVRSGGYDEKRLDVRAVRNGEAGVTIKIKYMD